MTVIFALILVGAILQCVVGGALFVMATTTGEKFVALLSGTSCLFGVAVASATGYFMLAALLGAV